MDHGVSNLTKQVERSANSIDGELIGAGGQRAGAVNGVCAQEAGECPIEKAVFKDISCRHGVGGELVHKKRLKLTLDKVCHDHAVAEPLGMGHGSIAATVYVRSRSENGAVDEQRAEVFDNEDGSPSNLVAWLKIVSVIGQRIWRPDTVTAHSRQHSERNSSPLTKILNKNLASFYDSLLVYNTSFAVLKRLLSRRVVQADAVVIANLGLLGNEHLELLDSSVRGHIDGSRKTPDGLLRSCSGKSYGQQ